MYDKITNLRTARLVLDLLKDDDAAFILELVNTEGWLHFIGDRGVRTSVEATAYIRRLMESPQLTYWVAREQKSGQPVGIVTLIKRPYLEHFDIGFAFLPEYQGKAYAYEAVSAVLKNLQQDPQYQKILATTVPGNMRSVKLLEKLGFRFEKEIAVEGTTLKVFTRNSEIDKLKNK